MGEATGLDHRRRQRARVWSLIVLASVLLVLSISANWIQAEALDTDWVVSATDEMLDAPEVREALAVYAVDQLYANVDVRGEIEARLPKSAKALATPAAAAIRQPALDLERKALASPRVQDFVSRAVRLAHEQFVGLIADRRGYLSSTGGEVTLDYGRVIADLAARLGVNSGMISQVQGVVRDLSGLEQRLGELQTRIGSARAELSRLQPGELSPEGRQRIESLEQKVAELQGRIASLRRAIAGAQEKAPSQLQGRLGELSGRLATLESRLAEASQRIPAQRENPDGANAEKVDASLARLEAQVTTLLGRQVVQNPGQVVVVRSAQLDGIQTLFRVLRNLGFVLPVLVLLLYAGALYLAKGWRPQALRAAGGGIVAAALLVLLARRLLGAAVVDSVSASGAVEPAIGAVWKILTEGLRERTLFVLVVGLAFVASGLLGGASRYAVAARRFIAPYLRDRPGAVYFVVLVLFLLWLALMPGTLHLGQVVAIVALAALAVVGIGALRRQTAQEFPAVTDG